MAGSSCHASGPLVAWPQPGSAAPPGSEAGRCACRRPPNWSSIGIPSTSDNRSRFLANQGVKCCVSFPHTSRSVTSFSSPNSISPPPLRNRVQVRRAASIAAAHGFSCRAAAATADSYPSWTGSMPTGRNERSRATAYGRCPRRRARWRPPSSAAAPVPCSRRVSMLASRSLSRALPVSHGRTPPVPVLIFVLQAAFAHPAGRIMSRPCRAHARPGSRGNGCTAARARTDQESGLLLPAPSGARRQFPLNDRVARVARPQPDLYHCSDNSTWCTSCSSARFSSTASIR